jgi:4a-hydroxytetrahydrobiopterin dehydratase
MDEINFPVMDLSAKKCVPCEGGVEPFTPDQVAEYLQQIGEDWTLDDYKKISRDFKFNNYRQTIDFVNKVAEIAEAENHHPVMHVYYSKVVVELWTHAVGGLSENDFIVAAKINKRLS